MLCVNVVVVSSIQSPTTVLGVSLEVELNGRLAEGFMHKQ